MKFISLLLVFILVFGCTQSSQPAANSQQTGESDIVAYEHEEIDDTATPTQDTSGLKSEEVSYYSIGWNIYATLYPAQENSPKRAVILMPMLGKTRESYPISFIKRIHDEIPDAIVLAVDSRGHGKSTSLGTYEDFDSFTFKDMQNDILDARPLLEDRYPSIKEYDIVGASIGSTAAILATAKDSNILKVAMLSPGMEYQGVSIERPVSNYLFELLLVAASGDSYSVSSIAEIEDMSSARITKKIYPGSAHGTDLFDATKDDSEPLNSVIMEFLKK